MSERMFPIMHSPVFLDVHIPRPTCVPWSSIERYEPQAIKNHGQTLKRLAERGGLSEYEMYAVVHGTDYHSVANVPLTVVEQCIEALCDEPLRKRIAELEAQVKEMDMARCPRCGKDVHCSCGWGT